MLAIAALVIDLRMRQWALGPRFLVAAVISLFTLGLAWTVPRPSDGVARPYQSVLMISGLLVLIFALQLFAEVLGAHHNPGAGAEFWTFAAESAIAVAAVRRSASAGCTLIAAFTAAISFLAFIAWAFHPHGFATFRWILLVETVILGLGAARLRRAYPRHAVQLVNMAGLVALVLSFTFLAGALVSEAESRLGTTVPLGGVGPAGFGWKLYVLVVTGALIAYAVRDRAPAPGVFGVLLAFMFALLVGFPTSLGGGSLVFWPLFLLIVGGIGVTYGLWPRGNPVGAYTGPGQPPGEATTVVPEPGTEPPPPPAGAEPPGPPPDTT